MSLGDDLLDAIAAAPDDPAARLIYADHRLGFSANDPHAELIIVQERLAELEATGLWRDAFSNEAENLRAREKELCATVQRNIDVRNLNAKWRRGFIDRISLNDFSPAAIAARIHHPAFRLVRTLHFQGVFVDIAPIAGDLKRSVRRLEGYFLDANARALGPIDEVSLPISHIGSNCMASMKQLRRLELTETRYVVPDEIQRDLAWGYRAARREVEQGAEDHAAAEQAQLAAALPTLPRAKHLVIMTHAPLERGLIPSLERYSGRGEIESLRMHTGADGAGRALADLPFKHVRLETLRDPDRDVAARAEMAIAEAYLLWNRPAEAANHCDDAFCFSEGRYPGVADRFFEAAKAAGLKRALTDPDPARDGLLHRVPALLRWRQLERVLAAAPNHRGAWALQGLKHRDDYELDDAEAAFEHALEGEPDAKALAKAYAVMLEDPPAALAILNHVAPSLHANVLFACIHALLSKPEIALGLLRDEPEPLAKLAVGIFERQRGKPALGREIWHALARVPYGENDPVLWVITFFAATLASADPYHRRRAFHDWLETAEPHPPLAALVFDPLIRVANKVLPQVDLTMVGREVDRLRGA